MQNSDTNSNSGKTERALLTRWEFAALVAMVFILAAPFLYLFTHGDASLPLDKEAVFVTEKSFQGKNILALEHPGLWNGGMGNWNTIFVEVSSKTFNPVKTVNDLVRKTHQ